MLTYVLIAALLTTPVVTASSSLANGKCSVEPPVLGILDINQAARPAHLLNVTAKSSLNACGSLCCSLAKCNAYIWRESKKCFLFNCKVRKDCKVKPFHQAVVGFVTRSANIEDMKDESSEDAAASPKLQAEEVEADAARKVKDILGNEKSGGIEDTIRSEAKHMESLNHVEPVVKKEDVASLGKKEYASWPSSHAEDAPTSNKTSKHFPGMVSQKRKAQVPNTIQNRIKTIPVLNMATASDKVTHTTTTSLIAALVFGIVFLIAVVVQVGKPWWESLFTNRDGYNRITFLMNGK